MKTPDPTQSPFPKVQPSTPQAAPDERSRRRSQRVFLAVPVVVVWTNNAGVKVREQAETEIVNAHGALLKMSSRLPMSIEIELTRTQIGQSARARVVGVTQGEDDSPRIAVELSVPSWTFWGVSFPEPGSTPDT